jgi:histone H3/H4
MEDYKRQIGKLAVAQLSQVMGFSSISSQALDTLEEVLRLLIEKIGERAKMIAEHSGRTECNLLDILSSLEVIQCSVDTINSCATQGQEFTFARSVKFHSGVQDEKDKVKDIVYKDNIPNFLPHFPPAHTYMFTPVPITRNMDAATLRAIKIKEKREIEERLGGIIGNMATTDTPIASKNPYVNLSILQNRRGLFSDN